MEFPDRFMIYLTHLDFITSNFSYILVHMHQELIKIVKYIKIDQHALKLLNFIFCFKFLILS